MFVLILIVQADILFDYIISAYLINYLWLWVCVCVCVFYLHIYFFYFTEGQDFFKKLPDTDVVTNGTFIHPSVFLF